MVDWQIRPYAEGDLSRMASVMTAGMQADGLDAVIGASEMESDIGHMGVDLPSGVLIVQSPRPEGLPDGLLPGFGMLGVRENSFSDQRAYNLRIAVHPLARELGLERDLVLRLAEMARARETNPDLPPRHSVLAKETFSPKQESQRAIFTAIGMRHLRTFWLMKCPLDNLPEPSPVQGVRIRPLSLPDDTSASMDALNGSFIDHYDFRPQTEERWSKRLSNPNFRPDLSWVAEIDATPGKIAGFCLCGIIEEENQALGRKEGWIETLGTVRGWRGKGLGRALLVHGLHSLKAAGMDTGVLGVDSENPTGATGLYESVGFSMYEEWLDYGCPLSELDTTAI